MASAAELRILEAAKSCCERWGLDRVTVDDIAAAAGVSRATLYRMFPGGKDVLFDALRVHEIDTFLAVLAGEVEATATLEDLIVTTVVTATRELRADQHLALMLASEPGETLGQLTVDGLPRIIRMASATLAPMVAAYVAVDAAERLIDVLARLTISYFLAPSEVVDLADEPAAREFLRPMIATFVPDQAPAPFPIGALS